MEDRLHVFHVDGTYERGGGTRTCRHGLRMIKKARKPKNSPVSIAAREGKAKGAAEVDEETLSELADDGSNGHCGG